MLVLYLSKKLLYDIFQGDKSRSTPIFVKDNGHTLVLLGERIQEFGDVNSLWHKGDRSEKLSYGLWTLEEVKGMYIAYDFVYIFLIDKYF